MKVLVNMKKMGKRRNSITQVPYELEGVPHTVKELIEKMVSVCVRNYNKNMENQELLRNLSLKEMEDMTEGGKISFGVNYGEKQAEERAAVENAWQCFEDGIYRIFYGNKQLRELEESIELPENSELTFVRLTMLAGRMW